MNESFYEMSWNVFKVTNLIFALHENNSRTKIHSGDTCCDQLIWFVNWIVGWPTDPSAAGLDDMTGQRSARRLPIIITDMLS